MENQLYVIYNKLSNRYEGVFTYPTDAVCRARIGNPDAKFNFDELEVCKVGTVDVLSGVITPSAPVRLEINPTEKLPVEEAK